MNKVKKTYRLIPATVEQIQAVKEYLSTKGLHVSDSQVIQMAISSYMDHVAAEQERSGD